MVKKTSRIPEVTSWLERVRYLSEEIGPRGPTGEGERKSAEYARLEFAKFGLTPVWETFKSALDLPAAPDRQPGHADRLCHLPAGWNAQPLSWRRC